MIRRLVEWWRSRKARKQLKRVEDFELFVIPVTPERPNPFAETTGWAKGETYNETEDFQIENRLFTDIKLARMWGRTKNSVRARRAYLLKKRRKQ